MDFFIEQMVEKKTDARDKALKLCVITAAFSLSVLIALAALYTGYAPLLLVIAGVIWLTSYILKGLSVEYEYILTNKDLDIDKVTGKRKRKRLVTLDLLTAEAFSRCDGGFDVTPDVTVSAHDNTYNNLWSLVARHKSLGRTLLLFSPSEEFAFALNDALPPRYKNRELPGRGETKE